MGSPFLTDFSFLMVGVVGLRSCFFFLGKCWMDALELALHCPALLARTMARDASDVLSSGVVRSDSTSHGATVRREMNETDREMHFKLCGL